MVNKYKHYKNNGTGPDLLDRRICCSSMGEILFDTDFRERCTHRPLQPFIEKEKSVSILLVTTQSASKLDATLSAYDGQRQRMCDKNHKLYNCFRFRDMAIDKR